MTATLARTCDARIGDDIAHAPAIVDEEPERLDWYPTTGMQLHAATLEGDGRTRCRCSAVEYEYGLIGGAYRIRRTDWRRAALTRVTETPAVQRSVAEEWWRKLRAGQAV